jgi:hypothetical protein
MKKHFINIFYLNIGLWSFFCLCLGWLVNAEIINAERRGNESDAAQTMQVIRVSQSLYAQKHQGRFAPNFDELLRAEYLDAKIFNGQKPVVNGYIFEMKVLESTGLKPGFYSINADPQTSESFFETTIRHFYSDSTLGAFKVTEESRQANADDASF